MQQSCTCGSVRGASGNWRPYSDPWNWGEPLGSHKLLGHAWVTEIQDDRSCMLPRTPFVAIDRHSEPLTPACKLVAGHFGWSVMVCYRVDFLHQ